MQDRDVRSRKVLGLTSDLDKLIIGQVDGILILEEMLGFWTMQGEVIM